MKRLLLSALVLSALSTNTEAQTVKKVLLEDFTGRWCGYCPNGTHGIEEMEVTYPANFLPAAVHNDNSSSLAGINDKLEIKEGEFLATSSGLGSKGFPSGAIDRKIISGSDIRMSINGNADQWKNAVANQVNASAIVSVGFENWRINDNNEYEVDINVEFESAPKSGTPVVLQVYVLEDSIAAESDNDLAQVSYTKWYGADGTSSPVYITSSKNNFWHNHTLRAALGGNWGFAIADPQVGKVWTKTVKVAIPSTAVPQKWVHEQLHMYAFVAYNGTAKADKEVLNAEEIHMSQFQKVGVNDIKNNISISKVYPNPANLNDVVKVSYNTQKSEQVTMSVYSVVGQKVAEPYVSNDVRGTHTISWRPSDHNLTPGMYFVEIASESGKQVQRISIR